jgi:hypothetical protein
MSIVKNALQAMERLSQPGTVKKARKAAEKKIKAIRAKLLLGKNQNTAFPAKSPSDS